MPQAAPTHTSPHPHGKHAESTTSLIDHLRHSIAKLPALASVGYAAATLCSAEAHAAATQGTNTTTNLGPTPSQSLAAENILLRAQFPNNPNYDPPTPYTVDVSIVFSQPPLPPPTQEMIDEITRTLRGLEAKIATLDNEILLFRTSWNAMNEREKSVYPEVGMTLTHQEQLELSSLSQLRTAQTLRSLYNLDFDCHRFIRSLEETKRPPTPNQLEVRRVGYFLSRCIGGGALLIGIGFGLRKMTREIRSVFARANKIRAGLEKRVDSLSEATKFADSLRAAGSMQANGKPFCGKTHIVQQRLLEGAKLLINQVTSEKDIFAERIHHTRVAKWQAFIYKPLADTKLEEITGHRPLPASFTPTQHLLSGYGGLEASLKRDLLRIESAFENQRSALTQTNIALRRFEIFVESLARQVTRGEIDRHRKQSSRSFTALTDHYRATITTLCDTYERDPLGGAVQLASLTKTIGRAHELAALYETLPADFEKLIEQSASLRTLFKIAPPPWSKKYAGLGRLISRHFRNALKVSHSDELQNAIDQAKKLHAEISKEITALHRLSAANRQAHQTSYALNEIQAQFQNSGAMIGEDLPVENRPQPRELLRRACACILDAGVELGHLRDEQANFALASAESHLTYAQEIIDWAKVQWSTVENATLAVNKHLAVLIGTWDSSALKALTEPDRRSLIALQSPTHALAFTKELLTEGHLRQATKMLELLAQYGAVVEAHHRAATAEVRELRRSNAAQALKSFRACEENALHSILHGKAVSTPQLSQSRTSFIEQVGIAARTNPQFAPHFDSANSALLGVQTLHSRLQSVISSGVVVNGAQLPGTTALMKSCELLIQGDFSAALEHSQLGLRRLEHFLMPRS